MGRGSEELKNHRYMPYDFVHGEGMVQLKTAQGVKSPVEISADILKTLKARAEQTPWR